MHAYMEYGSMLYSPTYPCHMRHPTVFVCTQRPNEARTKCNTPHYRTSLRDVNHQRQSTHISIENYNYLQLFFSSIGLLCLHRSRIQKQHAQTVR